MQFCFSTQFRGVAATLIFAVCITHVQADEQADFFERQIRPLLIDHCVSCHGPKQQEGGIRLDSREQVLIGTEDVSPLIVPGQPEQSRLFQVVQYAEDDVQMPPKARLPDHKLSVLRQWIEAGAVWPQHGDFGQAGAVDPEQWRSHWAFQPVVNPELSTDVADQHPIDALVSRVHAASGVTRSPAADGRTLVRRISYAITGLPPGRGDLNAARVIEDPQRLRTWLDSYTARLLATPQFGERWARYWLDIARYADTKGYVFREDREYKDAWRFREWVIKSLNDDMPYDHFLRMQLGADRMTPDDAEQLAAMGFLTLGRRFLNNNHDIIDDRIDVTSRGMLGLTVTCARCHDHKFDPIPIADYYSLYGIFDSSHEPKNEPSPLRLVDRPKPREPAIFLRGSPHSRGKSVPRRFLTALSTESERVYSDGSGRLELAQDITRSDNPLTARVAVNRIWLRLFGRGLVETPSDFGVRTPLPTHPELLDHLAAYFVEHNWSRKTLIQYIIASQTWQQSSNVTNALRVADPDNRLLSRMNRRRLDFEAFRDSVLAVCGNLDRTVGGESVDITQSPFPNRRTVYARIDRQNLPGLFRAFDLASPDSHAAKRFETTVPQQALFQLNSTFMTEQSAQLAERILEQKDMTLAERIRDCYQRILLREPTPAEREVSTDFFTADGKAADNSANVAKVAQFVQTLILTNEFFFVD